MIFHQSTTIFNAFPLNIPYLLGWKSVPVTRSVPIWRDLWLAREKQMVHIWSPFPKVPLFLQKEQLEMNIWNFVVGIIIRIRNIFLNTILWSSRSFTAFHSVCQTHENPKIARPRKKHPPSLGPRYRVGGTNERTEGRTSHEHIFVPESWKWMVGILYM